MRLVLNQKPNHFSEAGHGHHIQQLDFITPQPTPCGRDDTEPATQSNDEK